MYEEDNAPYPMMTLTAPTLLLRHPSTLLAGGLLLSAAAMAAIGAAVDARVSDPQAAIAVDQAKLLPASPTATDLTAVSPEEALRLNAERPTAAALGAAVPFVLKGNPDSRAQALECLTQAVYYEAGQESDSGQRAVAQVILNRVRHPAFPSSVCGVVYEGSTRQTGCQFTFTCDGSLIRSPMPSAWSRARGNAAAILNGAVEASVGNATHYHANYVFPRWAPEMVKTEVIGPHIFYRWAGGWGRPEAFTQSYSAREASASLLRKAALAVPHNVPAPLVKGDVATLTKEDGVTITRDPGGRINASFKVAEARQAVEKVKVVPYVEQVQASDTLRYALGDAPASDEAALGAPKPVAK